LPADKQREIFLHLAGNKDLERRKVGLMHLQKFDPEQFMKILLGSGQNWEWCHLLAHLALHKWFVEKGRPVPRFLILDQPTQIYYPAEKDAGGSLDGLKDSDRDGVFRIFKWLKDRVDELKGKFQLIVTDHAEVKQPWFTEAVVERWRNGLALIPKEWITSPGTSTTGTPENPTETPAPAKPQ
jgi:hypothetical protein